jgi:hypothetical protein
MYYHGKDVDSLIAYLTAVKEKYGNIPVAFTEEHDDGPTIFNKSNCHLEVWTEEEYGPDSDNGDWWEEYGNKHMDGAELPVLMIEENH